MSARRLKKRIGRRGGTAWLCILLAAACVVFALRWTPHTRAAVRSGGASPAKKPPNIVFILTDDLASNLVQFMPNVQAMQRDGTTFSNYFVTDSLCCPSRSSIFTGKFPHNTGVLANTGPDGGYEAFNAHGNEPLTFAVALQRSGYKTAMLGKYLNGYLPVRNGVAAGWNEWDVAGNGYAEFNYNLNQNGRIVHYRSSPQDYLTDVIAALGEAFMRKSGHGPFFIEIATFAPHGPYTPAPRDADKFPGLAAPRSAAFAARPDSDAPRWLKDVPPLSPREIAKIDEDFRMRAQAVQAVDKMIGEIRAMLAEHADDNTYVVFSSDNGLHMGEYSLRPGKMTPFETDIHVPLVVVGPGVPKGRVVDAIVENVDLFETFLEISGASSPASPDGHSLLPLLHGSRVTDWRDAALIEHHRNRPYPDDPDMQVAIAANPTSYEALRIASALYVEYEDGETGYYDLIRDPLELRNVASKLPAAKRKQLHEALRANKECQGAQACWTAQHLAPESGSTR
jgi:N-acetylglucosamine-6-sulfatase